LCKIEHNLHGKTMNGELTVNMDKLIAALLEKRGMTLAELTAELGYQSKTSLVRIMKNQASERALDTFAKRLNERLSLTEEEQGELAEAMEYLRWQDDYASSQEVLKFLRGEIVQDEEICLEAAEDGSQSLLSHRYEDASEIRITLLNCQYVPVFQQLLDMVRNKDASIEHFMLMREESARVIRGLRVLVPLVYEKNYAGYSYRRSRFGMLSSAQGVMAGDLMAVEYRAADGRLLEDMIVFDRAGHALVQTAQQTGSFRRMLGIRREDFESIKRTYFQQLELTDYLQFCREYARMENNRSVLKIKPDVSLELVPEDIVVSALIEGSILEMPQAEELVEVFRKIHRDRVRNAYEKRRVFRNVMMRSAMIRFVRTGRLSDHVWAMRPFTPEERVRILKLLLEHEENNPYFNLYFLKDNDFLRDTEIAYYDGVGVMVTDANTDYALAGNHSEVMLVHGGFMQLFRDYFERSILAEQVVPRAETAAFLNELIKIAMSET